MMESRSTSFSAMAEACAGTDEGVVKRGRARAGLARVEGGEGREREKFALIRVLLSLFEGRVR